MCLIFIRSNQTIFLLGALREYNFNCISRKTEEEQVFYGGEVVGESAVKYLEQIGSRVIHKYIIHNNGPWNVDEFKVNVLWPHQVENNKKQGKWLLYMTEPPIVEGKSYLFSFMLLFQS